MKGFAYLLLAVVTLTGEVVYMAHASGLSDGKADPVFGITIPPGYRDWKLISVAHEEGNLNDLRALLGNDVAIKAYRERELPLPEGTIIERLAWSYVPSEENNKVFGRSQSFVADPPRTFSLWSRTRRNMPRPEAGGLLNSKTANRPTRRCSKPAFPAASLSKLATLSLPDTHPNYGEAPWTKKNRFAIRLAKTRSKWRSTSYRRSSLR
jgi:Cytochrome P460